MLIMLKIISISDESHKEMSRSFYISKLKKKNYILHKEDGTFWGPNLALK